MISDLSDISDFDTECQSLHFDLSNGSPIDTKNVNIVHFNINSITANGRIDQLSTICDTLKVDVLILTETKLDCSIPNNLLSIKGYHEPIRRDRNRSGGGVFLFMSQNI